MGVNLISDPAMRANLESLLDSVFQTLKRAFTVYIKAQTAMISTSPAYTQFGQHDQNVFNPAVNPQATVLEGLIQYGTQQPWEYIAPENRTNYMQDKLRNSMGKIRIKVDITGYQIMAQCKEMNVDGFNFKLSSTARPHGLFQPERYTFFLDSLD